MYKLGTLWQKPSTLFVATGSPYIGGAVNNPLRT